MPAFKSGVARFALVVVLILQLSGAGNALRWGSSRVTSSEQSLRHVRSRHGSKSQQTSEIIDTIMDPHSQFLELLEDQEDVRSDRWQYLRPRAIAGEIQPVRRYFFAVNTHQSIDVIPGLLRSLMEVVTYLGPQHCVLSVIDAQSTDGTFEVLHDIQTDLSDLGVASFFNTRQVDIDADAHERLNTLAKLRNAALEPLSRGWERYDPETKVIFLDDVVIQPEAILELIHQKTYQNADMVCGMNWRFFDDEVYSFRDISVARTLTGHPFVDVSQSDDSNTTPLLFPYDESDRLSLESGQPFQVFSCWSGAAVFGADAIVKGRIGFRDYHEHECPQRETSSFCTDLWSHGYGRIAVVPIVNIGYYSDSTKKIKTLRGSVSDWIVKGAGNTQIEWRTTPPEEVECTLPGQQFRWDFWGSPIQWPWTRQSGIFVRGDLPQGTVHRQEVLQA